MKRFLTTLLICAPAVLFAQAVEIKRTPIQTVTLSTPGKLASQQIVEFAPGAIAPRHTHPGEEITYVMSGEIELRVDGQPPKVVKAGESFSVPEGVIHGAANTSSLPIKAFITYVVEKDRPVATMIK